ncbi:glycosyl hydrolase family 43 protein [Rutstroemia sp. NJR-2017a BBW]|nr:glycosyl hydrolase family 43 protein [Rutstroemia sp. NJR-2017a BBW]
MRVAVFVLALISGISAQQSAWGQCRFSACLMISYELITITGGGIGWTAPTTCASGSCCKYSNDWYSQCIPGSCTGSSSSAILSSTSTASIVSGTPITSGTTVATSSTSRVSSSSTKTAVSPTGSFINPVLYEDFADNDIFRLNDTYYYSASNMHFSPGAPILRSYDLVNWEFVGHSVPFLNFGSHMPGTCYYDCGLLIDDDDTMYVVYGGTNVSVAQLSADGLSQVKTQPVFNAADAGRNGIEGNRLYKRDGYYYVLDDDSQGTTVIWKATSPFGPYTKKILVDNINSPVPGGGTLDQGSLIQTQNDDWYFMSFSWAYPAGRLPVLAPITWGSDGFPLLITDSSGGWGSSYPNPLPPHPLSNWTGIDNFQGTELSPFPVGTVVIDFTKMADGDVAGLAAFRDVTSWIGVIRNGTDYIIQVRVNATQDESTWATTSTGTVMANVPIKGRKVWFRVSLDARASGTKLAQFYYSTNGSSFTSLGPSAQLSSGWQIFMGYRFGIFNFATKALGGSILATQFVNA